MISSKTPCNATTPAFGSARAFIAGIRTHIDAVIAKDEAPARLLHRQLSSQIQELNAKEENLIDLAADGALPQTKVKAKLRDIHTQRRRLSGRLDGTSADLNRPRPGHHRRSQLNQAIFRAL